MLRHVLFVLASVAIDCPELDKPENGNKNGEDRRCLASVEFNCNIGYKLNGSAIRTCQDDGTWSGQQPVCSC